MRKYDFDAGAAETLLQPLVKVGRFRVGGIQGMTLQEMGRQIEGGYVSQRQRLKG